MIGNGFFVAVMRHSQVRWRTLPGHREGRKAFFFEKRSKKLLVVFGSGLSGEAQPKVKSFLVLFFKKEPLCLGCATRPRIV
jgi:hypothetical protein